MLREKTLPQNLHQDSYQYGSTTQEPTFTPALWLKLRGKSREASQLCFELVQDTVRAMRYFARKHFRLDTFHGIQTLGMLTQSAYNT